MDTTKIGQFESFQPTKDLHPADMTLPSFIGSGTTGFDEKVNKALSTDQYELTDEDFVNTEEDGDARSIINEDKSKDEIDTKLYKDVDELVAYFKPFKRLSRWVFPFGLLTEVPVIIRKKFVDEIKFDGEDEDDAETLYREYHRIIDKFLENSSNEKYNMKHIEALEKIYSAIHLETKCLKIKNHLKVEKPIQDMTSGQQLEPSEDDSNDNKPTDNINKKDNSGSGQLHEVFKEMFAEGTILNQEKQMADVDKPQKGFESVDNEMQRQTGDCKDVKM